MHLDITISTAAYDGYPFEQVFQSMEKLGVNHVELAFIGGYTEAFTEDYFNDDNALKICDLLHNYNLTCTAFSSHVDLASEGIVDIFKNRMDFAKKVGARIIVTNTASVEHEELFYTNMAVLAPYAEEIGLYIGLENPGDGVDNLLNTGKQAPELIDRIGSAYVGINYDFGNLVSHCFEKEKPELDYKACWEQTISYHIKDAQADDSGWHFTEIGGGDIKYQEILSKILISENHPPISLEIPLRLRRNKNAQPSRSEEVIPLQIIEDTLKQSINFVQSVASQVA